MQDLARASSIGMEGHILEKLHEDVHAKAHVLKTLSTISKEHMEGSRSMGIGFMAPVLEEGDEELIDTEE